MRRSSSLVGCSITILLIGLVTLGYAYRLLPGLHYDEAWFIDQARRILRDPGYWPFFGMNSYTVLVPAYFLSGVFWVAQRLGFSASLECARLAYTGLSLVIALGLVAGVQRSWGRLSAWTVGLVWILHPLSIFNQRLHLDVVTFLSAGGVICFWAFLVSSEALGAFLLCFGLLLGLLSHILFVSVWFALIWVHFRMSGPRTSASRTRWGLRGAAIFGVPYLFAGSSVGESLKGMLAGAMVGAAALAWDSRWIQKLAENFGSILDRIVLFLAIPGVLFFGFFEWGGFWPYAQSTGVLSPIWGVGYWILIGVGAYFFRRNLRLSDPLLSGWLVLLLIAVFTGYKPTSARYWQVSLLGFLLNLAFWISQFEISELRFQRRVVIGVISAFVLYSGSHFYFRFLRPTLDFGATKAEFRFLQIFHDSAEYYRPVLPVLDWMKGQNLKWERLDIESGRNEPVLATLLDGQLGTPGQGSYFIGDDFSVTQNSAQLIHHEASWGDLSLWKLKDKGGVSK